MLRRGGMTGGGLGRHETAREGYPGARRQAKGRRVLGYRSLARSSRLQLRRLRAASSLSGRFRTQRGGELRWTMVAPKVGGGTLAMRRREGWASYSTRSYCISRQIANSALRWSWQQKIR